MLDLRRPEVHNCDTPCTHLKVGMIKRCVNCSRSCCHYMKNILPCVNVFRNKKKNMSTILAEIEQVYYRAIDAVKVSELDHYDTGVRTLQYPKDAFLQCAQKIDIYNLDKEKANFSLDKEMDEEFGEYRRKVQNSLRKHFQYAEPWHSAVNIKGILQNIGSCHDGSKVAKMDEVDSFYVLESDNIIVEPEPVQGGGAYRVFWKKGSTKFEIQVCSMRNQFADAYDKIISEIALPSCLKHGGYASPQHSGLRYNGPAATSQFLTKDNSLITWDMTPTFCLPEKEVIHHDVKKFYA